MSNRKLDTNRLYKLSKMLVFTITGIAVVVALYTGFMSGFGTDVLLNSWDKYCIAHPDDPEIVRITGRTCMSTGLEQVERFNDITGQALAVAILLPMLFFGGNALYKHLFPLEES